MEVDVVFAILGGIIGATIGQFKADRITSWLSRYFAKPYQKVCGIFNNSRPADPASD